MAEIRRIEVKTPAGPDELFLRSLSYCDYLGQLYALDVEVVCQGAAIEPDQLLGQPLSVSLTTQTDNDRFLGGMVHRIDTVSTGSRYPVFRLGAVPWLWFLGKTSDCRAFQHQTVPDIIKSVFRENGFSDFREAFSPPVSFREWEYCVQYRETDLNFVLRLMEEEGIYFFFEHEDGRQVLVLASGYQSHSPCEGYETINYYPPSANVVRDEDYVSEFAVSRSLQSGRYSLSDYVFERPKANLEVRHAASRSHPLADLEIYDYPGNFRDRGTGEELARARLEAIQAGYERSTAYTDARGLSAGVLFSLANFPDKAFNKEYLVVGSTQRLEASGFETGGGGSYQYRCQLELIDSAIPFRSPLSTPKPVVQGPQTATVVGPEGEEIHTDEFGRIKLQFHWDRYGKRDETSSCWVRVAQGWAGKRWGFVNIPRIGEEVIVDFLEGDPDLPIVTGRVYNGDNKVPYDLPMNKSQTGVKTRSTKGGTPSQFNELRFEDKKGSEEIYLHAEKDVRCMVENDETTNIGNDQQISVDNDRALTVSRDEIAAIGRDRTGSVGRNEQREVGKNDTLSVGEESSRTVGTNEAVNIGKKFTLEAGDEISLRTGQASIVLKSNGDIRIEGLKIVIKGMEIDASASTNAKVNAGAMLTLKGTQSQVEGTVLQLSASAAAMLKGSIIQIG